jgi:hypothetical protein
MDQKHNLSREYFDFLVHAHQFRCEGFEHGWTTYASNNMIIRVFEGRATPSVELRMQQEPDFTEVHLGTVLESFGKMTREQYEEKMHNRNIHDNFVFVTSLFKEFEQKIIYHPESWWLDAQKLVYEKTANFYKRTGQSPADDNFFYNLYKYLKSKDPNWTPKDPINPYWEYLEKKRLSNIKDEPN